MKMDEAVVVWTPGTNQCRIERLGSEWQRTPGDYWMPVTHLTKRGYGRYEHKGKDTKYLAMFIHFHTCVVRDKVDVKAAHQAFLEIDEYREKISPDIEGAD